MVEVPLALQRTLRLALAPDAVFALLADVPAWGALFPHVERIEPFPPAGVGAFLWTLEPLGPPGAAARTVYACRYHADAATRTVAWTPVDGVGNARFEGNVVLAAGPDGGTTGTLRLHATLDVAAPRWTRGVVVPAVTFEFGRMTDTFIGRLASLVP